MPTPRWPPARTWSAAPGQTQRIEHLFLEPESALAEPAPTAPAPAHPGPGHLRRPRQVARFLGLREDQILVELMPNGGAFGGKEDMSVQAQTALLAHLTAASR
jgi:xanthine dehydrogenase molybdopterin-binding subunit B